MRLRTALESRSRPAGQRSDAESCPKSARFGTATIWLTVHLRDKHRAREGGPAERTEPFASVWRKPRRLHPRLLASARLAPGCGRRQAFAVRRPCARHRVQPIRAFVSDHVGWLNDNTESIRPSGKAWQLNSTPCEPYDGHARDRSHGFADALYSQWEGLAAPSPGRKSHGGAHAGFSSAPYRSEGAAEGREPAFLKA